MLDNPVVSPARISAAATGVRPYVVARVSWLAVSRRARGNRLGTAASLAGTHSIAIDSMMNVAMAVQLTTSAGLDSSRADAGIEAKNTKRTRSQTTIVYRRSNRARAPAAAVRR